MLRSVVLPPLLRWACRSAATNGTSYWTELPTSAQLPVHCILCVRLV